MAKTKSPTAEPRKRGRPRTLTDDQQVPERRRKQLRVAQQAYRKRKETTIGNLQTRVEELESGIEKLSQSFLSFSNLLLEESVLEYHPRITSTLQEVTQQCVSLAKQGCNETDQTSVETGDGSSQTREGVNSNLDFDSEISRSAPTFQSESSSSTTSSLVLNQWIDLSPPLTPPDHEQTMSPFDSLLSGYIPPSIQSPGMTISPENLTNHRQWTLSHRIVRECSCNGYRLLVCLPNNIAKIQAVFGAILTGSQLESSIKGLYSAMVDDVGDTVDSRSKVLSHPYPNRDAFSLDKLEYVTRSWQLVAEAGAGEWLDASGVQSLIQERGIDIQPDLSQSCGFRIKSACSFDVTTFIKVLSRDCVCIGPGPAFRRKSVERALLRATQVSNDPLIYAPPCSIPD